MADKKISVKVVNLKGDEVGSLSLSSTVFGVKEANTQVVHDAVVVDMANARQATAKTKKRHEVSGGGKKPFRQKGTGRARAGSTRSPIWVGGGNVFGPDGNQNYKMSQNKKAHNLALRTVLSEKVGNGLIVVDSLEVKEISTKSIVNSLKAIKAEGKTLVVVDLPEDEKTAKGIENFILSAENIANVALDELGNVSVYDVLDAKTLVVSQNAIKKIEEALQ